MRFQIWKVKLVSGLTTISLRSGPGAIPAILPQELFTTLFPEVDLGDVPEAPNTGTFDITASIEGNK